MPKQTIAIEIDIPDGWEFVAHRIPTTGEHYLTPLGRIVECHGGIGGEYPIIREKPPVARPYNAAEMRALVGTLLKFPDGVSIVGDYRHSNTTVQCRGVWMDAEQLRSIANHTDGSKCEVTE